MAQDTGQETTLHLVITSLSPVCFMIAFFLSLIFHVCYCFEWYWPSNLVLTADFLMLRLGLRVWRKVKFPPYHIILGVTWSEHVLSLVRLTLTSWLRQAAFSGCSRYKGISLFKMEFQPQR